MNNKKAYFVLFVLVATELIGFGLIIPILPQISKQFTTSGMMIGILLSSYSFAQFIAAPLLGQLSDKFGRKPILILSKFGTIASYILLAYAPTYWVLLVSRLIDGFTGGNIAVARAYLSDITEEKTDQKPWQSLALRLEQASLLAQPLAGFATVYLMIFLSQGLLGPVYHYFHWQSPRFS